MAVGIASLVLGAVQTGVGLYKLSQEGDAPTAGITPEMKAAYARAEQRAKSGFSPQEKAAYESSLATAGNTAYRRGVDMGGGSMAQALRAGINAQQLGARNQFAATDAQLQRENIRYADSLAQQIQSQKNLQTAQELQQYNQRQQAYGQALQSGLGNIAGSLNATQALNSNMGGVQTEPLAPVGGSTTNPYTVGQIDYSQNYSYNPNSSFQPIGTQWSPPPTNAGNQYQDGFMNNAPMYDDWNQPWNN